jgi:hypothetical protein
MKPNRTIPWDNLSVWEPLLKSGVTVIWKGANGAGYRTTLLKYCNGNARLKFEDGHECEPCYVEQFVGIETATEIISITRE